MSGGASVATDVPISLAGVRLAFGDKVILDGLDLVVPRGRTVVLMGLSGTGKSVTLRTIAGLLRPDAGEIRVEGRLVDTEDRPGLAAIRRSLGYVFQHAALLRWMSVLDNVALPLIEAGVPRDEAESRARAQLEAVKLGDAVEKYPDQISGGMAKRAGFARAVVSRPKVILYDEPTTGLDPITTRTVDELILRGRDEFGATSVVVSHDVDSAFKIGDVVALLYEGKIAVAAPPAEFAASEHPVVREFVRETVRNGRHR